MFKNTLLFLVIFMFMARIGSALAEGPSYQPASSCSYINTTVSSAGILKSYDGTLVDFRINVESTNGKIRCTFGNAYGSAAPTSSSSVGYEIDNGTPFDAYPYVSPQAQANCSSEGSSVNVSLLLCSK